MSTSTAAQPLAERAIRSNLLFPALVCLASTTLIALYSTRLVDGVRLEPGSAAWQSRGVIVTTLHTEAGALRTGDIVVAASGKRMEFWAQGLFRPVAPSSPRQDGDVITYTVLRDGQRLDIQVTLGRYPAGMLLAQNWSAILFASSVQLITLFVLWRRPQDVAARALFVWAWSLSASMIWLLGLHVYDLVDKRGFWLFTAGTTGAWFLSWGAILHFALVFPQPHALTLGKQWVIPIIYVAPFVLYSFFLAISRPFAVSVLDWLRWWQGGVWYVAVAYLSAAIIIVIQQYHRSHGVTRRKIRWLAFAALLSLGASLLLWFLPSVIWGRSLISTESLGLLALPYPLALAVALLRHRLFDIDIIIRRTLVYSLLTVTLTILYFSSVVLLQQMLRLFAAQGQNQVVTSLATLAITALFRPLRRWAQRAIDKRFYRRKYDSEKVLDVFNARMRHETDVERLTTQLASTVLETLQPAQVSVRLIEARSYARQAAEADAQFPAVAVQSQHT